MTSLRLTTSAAPTLKVDAVVVGVVKGRKGLALAPGAEALADAVGKTFLRSLTDLGATGKAEEVTRLATLGAVKPAVVVAVGLGDGTPTPEALRRAAGAATRTLAGSARTVALSLVDPASATAEQVRAVAEGALLGAYAFTAYRSSSHDLREPVREVQVVVDKALGKDAAVQAAVDRTEVVCRAVALARDLVNTPPSDLHPAELAEVAQREAKRVGIKVEVLDHKALAKGGFGGITGVGQGSVNPPRLVHLSYRGGGPKIALVGKGITFDSGGLSLKPAAAMEEMKSDMGGAAAVIAASAAIAELRLPVDLDAWVPMAENMPSGTAIRPSDVLVMRGGKTVEVNNTDAEGRLILADAIVRACEDGPEVLLDAATLTGAQLVALGARTSGVMANDDALRTSVVEAAGRAGEAMWPMPLPAELKKGLDSDIADLQNTGPREGGMLTAGLFLQEFVAEGVRWAHLDIAGPAYNGGEAYGYTPHGGTGAAVRTFVQVVEELADV
ncbi:MAG TPA: leucyl aminopeptidase [Mycobacteriales bacterium]|nr:leucyl aminopeptidase [Mycobacteriales bacterium]